MKRLSLTLMAMVFSGTLLFGQSESEPVSLNYHVTSVGVGHASVYDSYLSYLKYTGMGYSLQHERMKWLSREGLSSQHRFLLNVLSTDNLSETASSYSGFLDYAYGIHYRLTPLKDLSLDLGGQANGLLGFVYNDRNGNNPATGKLHLGLNLSAMAHYTFRIKSSELKLHYQLSTPVIGGMFSQQYGQSYYEISLGNTDDLAHFSSFHNYLALRQVFMVSIPLKSACINLSYQHWMYETKVNGLETRLRSGTFAIGWSTNFYTIPNRDLKKRNYKPLF